ncbi:MAG: haloacid dehalogenase-like hydrolase [Deltaproteobacteria bacterium]|nr:haloacid dehalogenase-like hydrolase [Deltaproteobacteria bacterium]MBW2390368.1 haloacid dehalogenase-like hydrolase [Deltaproteobacteria bacterium]
MSEGSVLALFDFDKTLISRDSFRLLAEMGARSAFERWLLFVYAASAKLGWIDNRRYKTLVLYRIWRGRPAGEREELIDAHGSAMRALSIDAAWMRLRAHLENGDRVAVLSASPEFYLVPYIASISPEVAVHGSMVLETPEALRVENLYRERKAARAAELIERYEPSRVIVYTDHRDDIALMRLADHVVLVRPQAATRQLVREAGIEFEVLAK